MSDERPGLPWLMEASYGPESRAAALAARKAKHPDWNWSSWPKGGTTVHVHPGAPDHRIIRDQSVAIGAHGAFRVEQKDTNTPSGWRTAHRAAGLPTAKALVEKKAGIKDHSSMSVEELRQRGVKGSVHEKAAVAAELERRRKAVKQKVSAAEMKRRRTHAATMNRLAGSSGLPDPPSRKTRPVGGVNW
jgi:hypothetical protein